MHRIPPIDEELKKKLNKRIAAYPQRPFVVATGLTSSHLGDERNLREFIIASEVVNYLRSNHHNCLFLLIDDSYDPLNIRQLRVAVKKDGKLIEKFKRYCGMPIRLIPDPYECHPNYSAHFQQQILERMHHVGVYPNIIDTGDAYDQGLYDNAKKIVFTRYAAIHTYLKDRFPNYTMKKVFWPVCPKCHFLENVDITNVKDENVYIKCNHCTHISGYSWQHLKGKFSWKIDEAVKWNIYHTDFEPFSKAYLDPDVGSYFIAKALSLDFFGGNFPEVIEYGQVLMNKSFSYTLLGSFPVDFLRELFLSHRKTDLTISTPKIIQLAKEYETEPGLSYYNYALSRLPYDIFESSTVISHNPQLEQVIRYGKSFAHHFLNRQVNPSLIQSDDMNELDMDTLKSMRKLFAWITYHRQTASESHKEFLGHLNVFLEKHSINRKILFPLVRKILHQEHGTPLSHFLHSIPIVFLYAYLSVIDERLTENSSRLTRKESLPAI